MKGSEKRTKTCHVEKAQYLALRVLLHLGQDVGQELAELADGEATERDGSSSLDVLRR